MAIRCRFPLFALIRALWIALALAAGASQASELLWFEAGRPTREARHAIDVLAAAREQGLEPADYEADALARRLAQAAQGGAPGETAQAQLDAALTAAMQRYLSDVHDGRVDPRRVHADFDGGRKPTLDTAALLRDALSRHRLADAIREVQAHPPMYDALVRELAHYRALPDPQAWDTRLPPLPGRKVIAGQAYAGVPLLARRLKALGDLAAGTAVPERFEGTLVKALQAFQERHGLTPDGVLGAATLQQLEATPAMRARQIELSMERLRWTPLLQGPRMIVVNIPEFVLRAYEVQDGQVRVQASMKVIVGKALNTRTPLFDEAMRFIEFSPYWNVPPSIARNETVPKLRRDPGYFEREGFEFVTSSGQVVSSLAPQYLDAVLHGGWRIRQRPGPRNALGDIKFVFPNNDNIYLHHTPTPQLFERDRRDFSHGCIRVQSPVALAQFVLREQPEWTEARIRETMENGTSSTLALKHPVPVLIAYSTVTAKGGRVFFYPDLYGHDRLLDEALRRRSAQLPPLFSRGAAPN